MFEGDNLEILSFIKYMWELSIDKLIFFIQQNVLQSFLISFLILVLFMSFSNLRK